jgi:hypothetical protein
MTLKGEWSRYLRASSNELKEYALPLFFFGISLNLYMAFDLRLVGYGSRELPVDVIQ